MFDWDLVQLVETCWTQWTQGQQPAAVLRKRPLRFLYKCCTNNPEIGLKRSCSFTSAYDSALTLCGTLTGDEEKQATRLQEKWARTYQRGANETMWLYVSSRQPVELALLEGLGFSWKNMSESKVWWSFFLTSFEDAAGAWSSDATGQRAKVKGPWNSPVVGVGIIASFVNGFGWFKASEL